jgi:hypothetical protein
MPTDRVDRVQRGHRVLEDHRDLVAAQRAELARRGMQDVLAVEEHLAARDRVDLRVEAHDRQAGDALAAAGLANDAESLAILDREADAVDGLDDAVVGAEMRLKVADLEQRHALSLRPA